MSYTQSAAQAGLGSIISINTGTQASPTWTQIFEINSAKLSGRQTKTADVTNLQSPAAEYIATIVEPGTFDCTGNRVHADPGQTAVDSAFSSLAAKQFQVQLPKISTQTTQGDAYTFSAVVQEWESIGDISPDKAVVFSLKLKITGQITYAAGS